MTSLPKIALSMLISVIIFAGCLLFSFAGGFKFIEVQYWTPRVIGNINNNLEEIKSSYGEYWTTLDECFREFLSAKSVTSYIETEPSKENMDERDRLCGILFQKNPGLDGIRLIENDGIHIHYSTFQEDVYKEAEELITYANYTDRVPFSILEAGDNEKNTKVYFDNSRNRLIFSYPFYDVYTACRGTMVFYVAGDDFTRFLISKDVVSLNTRGAVLSPTGFVFNIPLSGRNILIQEIQERWAKRNGNIEQLIESDVKKENLFVIYTTNKEGIKIGWICNQEEFEFSEVEKVSLLICFFITIFLIIFLLFNMRHDDMVIIRRRLRKFQYGLLKEYIERKDTKDWKSLSKEIASRRMDLNDEIKKSLGNRGKKHSEEIDLMLEESWQDIMAAVGASSGRILVEKKVDDKEKETESLHVEEIEKNEIIEEVEELEEVAEAEPIEAEDVEEISELDSIEEAEEVEELEEIPDAESVEDEIQEVDLSSFIDNENDAKEKDEIIEQSFSEYVKDKDLPIERVIPSNADEIKQKSKDSFSIANLNFSNLDGEK